MINGIINFFSEQWRVIASSAIGLFLLWRGVEKIGQARIDAEDKKRVRDAFTRIHNDKVYMAKKRQEMGDITFNQLLNGMRLRGETRNDNGE